MINRLLNRKRITAVLLASAAVVAFVLLTPRSPGASSCQDACYAVKSNNYKKCRAIPPRDRGARVKCFRAADQELKRCLSSCKP